MDIAKSTRHSKVIGEFGEAFLCNWLSRSGFEVTVVDHTGIDIIAYHPPTEHRLGITVKSRTRKQGKETEYITVFSKRANRDDRAKLRAACEAFACVPWIGIYVETRDAADLYLTSVDHYDQTYRGRTSAVLDTWKMTEACRRRYAADPHVQHVRVTFETTHWEWGRPDMGRGHAQRSDRKSAADDGNPAPTHVEGRTEWRS